MNVDESNERIAKLEAKVAEMDAVMVILLRAAGPSVLEKATVADLDAFLAIQKH